MSDNEDEKAPPSRVQVLIDNYRESREEGLKLVHSVFNDIAFSVALLGAVISGGAIAGQPELQLLIPYLIGGITLYAVQKLRVNNLITCYLVYLEKEINKAYAEPLMIWASEIVSKNVSAGRQSKWGQNLLAVAVVVVTLLYAGICYWAVNQNAAIFAQGSLRLVFYLLGCALIFIFDIAGVVRALAVTRQYTPEYIEHLVQTGGTVFRSPTRKSGEEQLVGRVQG